VQHPLPAPRTLFPLGIARWKANSRMNLAWGRVSSGPPLLGSDVVGRVLQSHIKKTQKNRPVFSLAGFFSVIRGLFRLKPASKSPSKQPPAGVGDRRTQK